MQFAMVIGLNVPLACPFLYFSNIISYMYMNIYVYCICQMYSLHVYTGVALMAILIKSEWTDLWWVIGRWSSSCNWKPGETRSAFYYMKVCNWNKLVLFFVITWHFMLIVMWQYDRMPIGFVFLTMLIAFIYVKSNQMSCLFISKLLKSLTAPRMHHIWQCI